MWHRDVESIVWDFFRDVCRGDPKTIWDYRRIMRRLGVRMKVVSGVAREVGPHVRRGVVYVPKTRSRRRFMRKWLAHELAEFATYYDGIPPYRCPSSTALDRHLVARLAERRVE